MPSPDANLEHRNGGQVTASIRAEEGLLGNPGACVEVADVLIQAYREGHSALMFGNGRSAADAQHIAGEFVGWSYLDRPALPAHARNVNTSILTSIANDLSYEVVFARQVEAIGRPGDVSIGLSTSGRDANVVAGQAARDA